LFDKLVGNEKIKESLRTSLEKNNIVNSYMFVGKSGIGKKLFARDFSEHILFHNGEKTDVLNSEDYVEIRPLEGKKVISIDQIRELTKYINELPVSSDRRIFVIDEAEKLTSEAQNAFLKTLEEPPKYAIIILIVSNESQMLETVRSRCTILRFDQLSKDDIKEYLNSHKEYVIPQEEDVEIKLLDGSLENIENLETKIEQYRQLDKLARSIRKKNTPSAFNNAELLYEGKDDIIGMLEILNIIFFNMGLTKCVLVVENTKKKILANNNHNMCIDFLIMKCIDSI
jgi:DNA polymerase-3 subunit delta'